MKLRLSMVFFCCLFISLSLFSRAEAKIRLTPNFTLEEEYTDNLFLQEDNEEDDWITTLAPGLLVKIDSRWIDLSLDYSFRFEHYMNHDNLTDFDFEGGQRADLGTTLFEGRPFTLGVYGTIRRETLDESQNSSDANQLVNKSTVYDLTVHPRYRFRLGTESFLEFGYIYDRTDHEDPRGDDSQSHSGRVSLIKELSTNTEVSANYTYKIYKSDDEDEYDRQSFTLGFEQQFGPRLTVSLEGGLTSISYTDVNDEADGTTWSADLTYHVSAPITLSVMFSQDYTDSAIHGLTKSRDATFSIDYAKDSFGASIATFWSQSDYIRISREDKSYGGWFYVSIPLYSNLSTDFDAEYETSEYRGGDVIDKTVDLYSLGVSLDYEISRFLTSLSYEHRVNDSDLNGDDYTENTVTLSIRVRF